jgi:RNA polymerase sigma factor (sigma-70 family)
MTEDAFARHRSLLFTVAYEMLGSASDAEDVVQETWLRWSKVDHSEVLDHRAYLVRIVTRQALNRLRTLARRREDYVGEWLPEPLLTGPDVAEDVELAESVSIAMLTVLETLSPAERAVFVLREVFDTPYGEIGERFLAAVRQGDLQGLLDVLAPDVVLVADGGGLAAAIPRPIPGAERVARLLVGAGRIADLEATAIWLNGSPGGRIDIAGALDTAVSLTVQDGRITRIFAIRNPHKLARLDDFAALTRS